MAATVLESVVIPRPSSGFRRTATLPSAIASSLSSRVSRGVLPEFRGLRVSGCSWMVRSAAGVANRRLVRRGVVCEAQETAVEVPDVTKSTWQSLVMEGDLPVLVEFWAPWCGPCRMIHPVISELSKEYAGKMKCLKLNTDESPDIATQYGIRSIPTIMIFKNGEKKDTVIGAVPKTTLVTSIEKFL